MNNFQPTQSQLDWFSEISSFVDNYGLSNLDREDRILFRKINKVLDQQLNECKFQPKERIPFTLEEILPAWFEYLDSYKPEGCVKVYDRKVASQGMAKHRKDPALSAMCILGQINFYDTMNQYNKKKFDRCGKIIKSLMVEYNESTHTDRFSV